MPQRDNPEPRLSVKVESFSKNCLEDEAMDQGKLSEGSQAKRLLHLYQRRSRRARILLIVLLFLGLRFLYLFAHTVPSIWNSIRDSQRPRRFLRLPRPSVWKHPPKPTFDIQSSKEFESFLIKIIRDEQYPPHIRGLLIQALRKSTLNGFDSSLFSLLKNTNVVVRASAALALYKNGSMDVSLLRSNLLADSPHLSIESPVIYEDLHNLGEHDLAYDLASQCLRIVRLHRPKYWSQFDTPWSDVLQQWPLRASDKAEILSQFRKQFSSPEETLCIAKLLLPHPAAEQMLRDGLKSGGWLEQWEKSEERKKLQDKANEDRRGEVANLYWLGFSFVTTFRWVFNPSEFDADALRTAGTQFVEFTGDLVFYREIKRFIQSFQPVERSDFHRNYIWFTLVPFDASARQFTIEALKSPWPGVAFEAAKTLGMSNDQARAVVVEALWGRGKFSGTVCSGQARELLDADSPEMEEYRCIIAEQVHAQTQNAATNSRGRGRIQAIEDDSPPSAIEKYFQHPRSPNEVSPELQRAALLEYLSLPLFTSFDVYSACWAVANDYAKDYVPPTQ